MKFPKLLVRTILVIVLLVVSSGCSKEVEQKGLWGSVESKEVDINTKIPGRVISLLVKEGEEVKAGQNIARIDSRDLLAKLDQAKAQVQSLEAQMAQAGIAVNLQDTTTKAGVQSSSAQMHNALVDLQLSEKNYKRAQELFNSGAIAEKNLDEARAKYQAAQNIFAQSKAALAAAQADSSQGTQMSRENEAAVRGKLVQAKAAVEELQILVDETEIKSPISGVVTSLVVEEGEMISSGMPLMTIMDPNNNWVNLKVKETELSNYKLHTKVILRGRDEKFKIEGTVVDINKKPEFATYRATNERGETDIITFNVKVQVNSDMLRPGMRFQVLAEESVK